MAQVWEHELECVRENEQEKEGEGCWKEMGMGWMARERD